MVKTKTLESRLPKKSRSKPKNKGYVLVEDVIGVRNPRYNEDNIDHETMMWALKEYPSLRMELIMGRYGRRYR